LISPWHGGSLRQGSMIHVYDQDFAQKVAESFHEAYMPHTSTSPA
jgi:arginine decarboxylase